MKLMVNRLKYLPDFVVSDILARGEEVAETDAQKLKNTGYMQGSEQGHTEIYSPTTVFLKNLITPSQRPLKAAFSLPTYRREICKWRGVAGKDTQRAFSQMFPS